MYSIREKHSNTNPRPLGMHTVNMSFDNLKIALNNMRISPTYDLSDYFVIDEDADREVSADIFYIKHIE